VSPNSKGICNTPLVLQVTDDDLDGRITTNDDPDVVFLHWTLGQPGEITALDGATMIEHFTIPLTHSIGTNSIAAGDIDGDGLVEIIAGDVMQSSVIAFEHDGTHKWTSEPSTGSPSEFGSIGIADFDQDGTPEIYLGSTVWNADGSIRWSGTGLATCAVSRISTAADIDPTSPGLELLAEEVLYDAAGTVLWSAPFSGSFSVPGDLDGDGIAEIVATTPSALHVLDHLGNQLDTLPSISWCASPPVLADIDGDGLVEVILVTGTSVTAFDWIGSLQELWTTPTLDSSRLNGASAYDLDGDGASEILYHDMVNWYIFDGRTGATLFQMTQPSATGIEAPVVANIDGDCAPEILISGCQGGFDATHLDQLLAFECDGGSTPRSLWNQYTYHVTNVNDDGTIPAVETPPWQLGHGWMEQEASPAPRAEPGAAGPSICEGQKVTLDGGASSPGPCPGALEYRWLDAGSPICTWSATPVCEVAPLVTTVYTLEVRCPAGCASSSAELTIPVRACPLAVVYDEFGAEVRGDGAIAIRWRTITEEGTLGFLIERAPAAAGPWSVIGEAVADRPGTTYTAIDPDPNGRAWYRIVELTAAGPGDATPAFQPSSSVRPAGGRDRRAR